VLLGIDLAQGDYAGVVGDALGLIPLGGGELAAGSRLAREASAIGREAQEVGIIENAVRTCGAGSFTAGTSVLTDKGSRPIEDIKVGERVLSRDERTGAQDWHFVMATTVNKEPVYKLHLHGQEEGDPQDELGVSAEHPFWVKAKGWTAAAELKSDSEVQDAHGEWLQVGSLEPQSDEQITYNLSVEGSHSFFVGENWAWVHNNKCNIDFGLKPANDIYQKGLHVKVNGLELSVRPHPSGGVKFEPTFSTKGLSEKKLRALDNASRTAQEALADPNHYAKLYNNSISAVEYAESNASASPLAQNLIPELIQVRDALFRMGLHPFVK
jgi:hypothetical protein